MCHIETICSLSVKGILLSIVCFFMCFVKKNCICFFCFCVSFAFCFSTYFTLGGFELLDILCTEIHTFLFMSTYFWDTFTRCEV